MCVILFQEAPKGRGSKRKFLTDSTKLCIRPVEEIITDEYSHRERGNSSGLWILLPVPVVCP
jgi:hypothetical protein